MCRFLTFQKLLRNSMFKYNVLAEARKKVVFLKNEKKTSTKKQTTPPAIPDHMWRGSEMFPLTSIIWFKISMLTALLVLPEYLELTWIYWNLLRTTLCGKSFFSLSLLVLISARVHFPCLAVLTV